MVWDRLGHSVEDRDGRTESDGRSQAGPLFVLPGKVANATRSRYTPGGIRGPAKAVG